MNRDEIFKELDEIFKDIFDDDSISVNEETTSNDIEEWDSLEHINLIVAIEQKFGIKLTMEEVITMKNVGNMADIIMEKRR